MPRGALLIALAAGMAAGCLSDDVHAAVRHGDPPPGTVGLLSIPAALGGDNGLCFEHEPAAIALFADPEETDQQGHLIGERQAAAPEGGCAGSELWRIDAQGARHPQPWMEHGYEAGSLIVLEARAPWYRVALDDGSAWLSSADGHYRPLIELYAEGLNRLTSAWDGALCDGPDADRVCAVADAARLRENQYDSVEVIGAAEMPDGLWLEVEVITSPCLTDVQRRLPIRGWLRAHAADRTPNVWFYSRGC